MLGVDRRHVHEKGPPEWVAARKARGPIPIRMMRVDNSEANLSTLMYMAGVAVLFFGLSYAAVPLYQVFCQATGAGGEVQSDSKEDKVTVAVMHCPF